MGGSVVACHPRPTAAGLVAEVSTSARIAAPARIAVRVVPPRSPFRGNIPDDGGGVCRGLVGGLCLGRGISWTLPTALALALAPDLLQKEDLEGGGEMVDLKKPPMVPVADGEELDAGDDV